MVEPRQHADDEAILSAYVDGELSASETTDVEARLAANEHARQVVAQLRQLKDLTAGMRIKQPPAEEWEVFWTHHYNVVERSLGWLLLVLGGVVVLGWATLSILRMIWSSTNLPVGVRWGALGAVAGVVVLLVSVVRERLHKRKHTRYKDIVR